MKFALYIVLFLSCLSASGIPLPKCPTSNLAPHDQAAMLHKVLLLGADDRQTIEEYARDKAGPAAREDEVAKEVERLKSEFSGLGILTCGGAISTAQLTGANNVITFAGHTQYGSNCEDYRSKKDRCFFKPVFLDHPPIPLVTKTIKAHCDKPNGRRDWGVAKLQRPIPGARFLKVPEKDIRWRRDTKITQLSGRHFRNFRQGNQSPTIQECSVRGAGSAAGDFHDCDTDGMSSGSAHIDITPKTEESASSSSSSYTLLAINTGEGLGQGTPTGTPDDQAEAYDYKVEEGRYNTSVPVAGEFRQAILKAIGSNKP